MSHYAPSFMPSSTSSSSSSSSSSSLLSRNFLAFPADHHDMDLDAQWQAFAHLAPQLPHNSPALAKATKDLISLHPAPKPRPIAPQPAPAPLPPPRISRAPRRPSPPPQPRPHPPPKPTLLSPQQKKANHIQSEQKRRANIRRGYEALCDTVPALREALRAEEQSPDGRRKRLRMDPTVDGEKIDGRAGPRSESVVLQKTIDHIHGLRGEQSALVARLEHARSYLCPGHPALIPETPPLWERSWDGGKGLMTDEPDDEE